MSRDDYTPARLRELADAEDIRHSIMWPNSFSKSETAAALRAAADTLAAREALLTNARKYLVLLAGDYDGDYDIWVAQRNRARALAAEIAAALKETDQ